MSIRYWINENGNGAYCEGVLPDGAYNEDTCILVSRKPYAWSCWDNTGKTWISNCSNKIAYLRNERDLELTRTDKYAITDYYNTFTSDQQIQIMAYRQALRNFSNVAPYDLPVCPSFMLN